MPLSTATAHQRMIAGWTSVLQAGVHGRCLEFDRLREDPQLRRTLSQTRTALASIDTEQLPSSADRLAFWLDAHNLCVLDELLRGLDQDPDFDVARAGFGVLYRPTCQVGDRLLSPEQIANQILLGRTSAHLEQLHHQVFQGDPVDLRLLAARYLGARSGPALDPFPLSGRVLDSTLERLATRWVDDPLRGGSPEGISVIFSWYLEEFGGPEGVAAFFTRHRSPWLQPVALGQRLPFSWAPDRYLPDDPACRTVTTECVRQPEECNGRDDDCDGMIDEDLEAPALLCPTLGLCRGLVPICLAGQGWGCDFPVGYEPLEQTCDGFDNDCDGAIDEELEALAPPCNQLGVCQGSPAAQCAGSQGWSCAPPPGYEAPELSCDGLDNDCNGVVDDVVEVPAGRCPTLGVCSVSTAYCSAGSWVCTYPPTYESGQETTCDGLDNDCDGATDELTPCGCINMERRECGVAVGACLPGIQYCWMGEWSECSGLEPVPEVCDGRDNDCDGVTDELLVGCECRPGTVTMCGDTWGPCYAGYKYCQPDGTWGPCEGAQPPEPEICDGWDNDCDGETDEAQELVPPEDKRCRAGGVCGPEQLPVCRRGVWTCLYPPAYELVERSCDGLDNDCNGQVDDGLVLPDARALPHPRAWDDEECWAAGDWEGPAGCCPPRFRVARCVDQSYRACCLFEICGDPDGRDDDCDGLVNDPECE